MIVLINSPPHCDGAEVAGELAGRFEAAGAVDGLALLAEGPLEGGGSLGQRLRRAVAQRVAALKAAGRPDVIVAYTFYEPEPLARLRRELSPLDDVIYAFRPRQDREVLARQRDEGDPERLADLLDTYDQWLASQAAGARRGDMGYELAPEDPGPAALACAIFDDIHEPVELVPPDPRWPRRFEEERGRILAALGPLALGVEHVGSTAVPELVAKPIIDIMISVADLEADAVGCIAPLAALGYAFVDYPQNTDRRFHRKGRPRSHHVQLVQRGGEAERSYLRFRDALRARPELREAYARLKREAQAELSRDRAGYGARKGALIRSALA
jgi:GrpB-like predicted nucleotidyltransferase (UPF0157 family)